jgi:PhzF family phenazine biosynthesis protein
MHIHALRCFGAHPGDGNPVLVIEDDASSADARQALARERDVTCVWIDPASNNGSIATLDFYYPHTRSPLCVHATLAAAHVLFVRHGEDAPLAVRTAMHGQELGLTRHGDDVFVRLAPQTVTQPAPEEGLVERMLQVSSANLIGVPQVASVGSPKLLVEVADEATLHALTPDLAGVNAWSKLAGVNGMYVYCRRPDGTFEGRNFNHLDPRLEDSATGVAAGALSVLLGCGLTLRQGQVTGRDCLIRTRVDDGAVLVGGRVETLS